MAFTLTIINGNKKMIPCVLDGIDLEWTRQGAPGQLTFTVLKDKSVSFVEGNAVTLHVDDVPVFYGFVLKKSRDKEGLIKVTCMDQLFYLTANQTVYVARNEKASKTLEVLSRKRGMKTGTISDTGYIIEKQRFDEPTTYMDIMQKMLDITLAYSSRMYVLYDDFGKLTLKDVEEMKLNPSGKALLITESSAENFDYESTIETSYNEVSLWQPTTKGDNPMLSEVANARDAGNIQKWGNLTMFELLDKDETKENAKLRAKYLLELHNQVKRKLSIKGAFCDPNIRGGSSVLIDISLGDVTVKRWFMVESVKHHFANDFSTMDLDVKSSKGFVL